MTRELNDAGVPGRVYVVPVAAKDAGTWLVAGESAWRRDNRPDPCSVGPKPTIRLDDVNMGKTTVRVPIDRARETSGAFYLVAGRPAEPGEAALDLRGLDAWIGNNVTGLRPGQFLNCDRRP